MNKVAVGIDIGGTNTIVGIVDAVGNILAETSFATRDYPDFGLFVKRISRIVGSLAEEAPVVGIGIGAPNANYYTGTIENAANLLWRGCVNVREEFARYFPSIPTVLTNDANAAAIGEMVYGNARGIKDFIMVTLGTGLGSGFVANGLLINGHDSFAGELGHIIVERDGRECGCGRAGCLETYVSATGIKRTMFELLCNRLSESTLRHVCFDDLDAEMITRAAVAGDALAVEAYEYTGMRLGRALADAVALTSPAAIFLLGGLAKSGALIFEPTVKHFEQNLLSNYRGKVKIMASGLEDKNAAILGSSALAWNLHG